MKIPPMAALELGTSRIVICVGECKNGRRIKVTGIGTFPSSGIVRKGQIIEVNKARVALEAVARDAERNASVTLGQLLLCVSGDHIQTLNSKGHTTLRQGKAVTREDVEYVRELAHAVELADDRLALNTIEQNFTLDERANLSNPEGLLGTSLYLDSLVIHGLKKRIDDVINVVKNARFDVTDVVFSGICAALATLSEEQRRNGVLMINLGGGTTSYILYHNNVMTDAGCLAVGGEHVTNDIALAFNISQSEAEEIKRKEGTAMFEAEYGDRRIQLTERLGGSTKSINRRALHTVINARMNEIFEMIRDTLAKKECLSQVGTSVVLTGGGAYLRRTPDLAQHVFGRSCNIGMPVNVDGLENVEQPAAYATVAGLAMYGASTYEGNTLSNWFARILGREAWR